MLPAIRSRLATAFAGGANRRLLRSYTSVPKGHRFSYSSSAAYDGAASSAGHDSSSARPPPPTPASGSALSKLLKLTLFGAVTGAVASTGYATYAYTLDEVDQKTKAFRASANYDTVGDNASTIDKIQASVRSKAMKASVEAIELYLNLRRTIEERVQDFTEPSSDKLLPDMDLDMQRAGIFTIVLDLSETLIHSDWNRERGWRTYKRPGVDAFLEYLCQNFEIVVYSDQLSTYVEEIVEALNRQRYQIYKLNRAATKYQDGKHYRDLSKLNRDPSRIIYVSGHALENALQPENCVQIKAWKAEDMNDTALLDLIPFLECVAKSNADIRSVIASYEGRDIATEFLARTKEHQRSMLERNQRGSSIWHNLVRSRQ